jgi:hypothetical protein
MELFPPKVKENRREVIAPHILISALDGGEYLGSYPERKC